MIAAEDRVPPGWRKIVTGLQGLDGIEVIDAFEDIGTGHLHIRALLAHEGLSAHIRAAEELALETCRECGIFGRLHGKRVLCLDHAPKFRRLRRIIRNSARCEMCGDEIESAHRHDFRWCSCRNIAVDGGREYIRRIGMQGPWTDTSIHEGDDDDEAMNKGDGR